jgi:hypothetical protein
MISTPSCSLSRVWSIHPSPSFKYCLYYTSWGSIKRPDDMDSLAEYQKVLHRTCKYIQLLCSSDLASVRSVTLFLYLKCLPLVGRYHEHVDQTCI